MNKSALRAWPLVALLLLSAAWLFRTPYSASNLEVPPDTVEYAVAPLELLENGHYQILMQGRGFPPRYPPWFPASVILPAYILFGHEPGNAILPITIFAVAGIGCAWAIGRRIGGEAGAILAGLTLLAVPTYRLWAAQVMTDVPCTVLMLAGCLLFLRVCSKTPSMLHFALAGALIGVSTLFRPVFLAMLLPFLFAAFRARQRFIRSSAALFFPIAVALAASLSYNTTTFGSATRNGYHFWTPVPYDFPALTFSLTYVWTNLVTLWQSGFPWLLAAALGLWPGVKKWGKSRAGADALTDVFLFVAMTTGPILVFHLLYFFPASRFYLPMLAGLAVIVGGALGLLLRERGIRILKLLLPALLLLVFAYRFATPSVLPGRRIVADQLRKITPPNAIVVSGIDPVYLERLTARGSNRRIMPFSRQVEYASKLIARKKIVNPQPPPANARDHRAEGLIRGGAEEAILFVASEQIEVLAQEVERGTPVFIETSNIGGPRAADTLAQMNERFAPVLRAPDLYQLELRRP